MNNDLLIAIINAGAMIVAYAIPSLVVYSFLSTRLKTSQNLKMRLIYAKDLKFMNELERRMILGDNVNRSELRRQIAADIGWLKSENSEDARLERDIERLQRKLDDISSNESSFFGLS